MPEQENQPGWTRNPDGTLRFAMDNESTEPGHNLDPLEKALLTEAVKAGSLEGGMENLVGSKSD